MGSSLDLIIQLPTTFRTSREGAVLLLLYTDHFPRSHLLPLDFQLHLCTFVGWGYPISRKKQEFGESILPKWQTTKPYVSSGERRRLPWCTVVAGHDDLSTGGVTHDPD